MSDDMNLLESPPPPSLLFTFFISPLSMFTIYDFYIFSAHMYGSNFLLFKQFKSPKEIL